MIAVELYRPDELNLYAASAYPLASQEGGFAHVSSQHDGAKLAAHSFMSGQSFKLNDDEDDDEVYHDALQSAPHKVDDENPYLSNKSSVKKSQRKLSKEERKSKLAAA